VQIELAPCLEPERDAILHAARVELGPEPPGDDVTAIAVRVACAPDGGEAGVVLEVRLPGNPRRYRYALDWRHQPEDARPRLVGLAIAEAVEASQIELVAVPEPAPALASPPPPARARASWELEVVADRRSFSARAGLELVGLGLRPMVRLSAHLHATGALFVETATALTPSGAIRAVAFSAAPGVVYRIGDRVQGELGVAALLGLVRLRGEALPGNSLVGTSQVRLWGGPAASLAIGLQLGPAVAATARLELGIAAAGVTARDLGTPAAAIDGAWASLGLGVTIAL